MVRSFGPADPVDAPVGLLRLFVEFAVGGLLMGRDHSPSHVPLSPIHPEGSIPSSSPEEPGAATSCMDPG